MTNRAALMTNRAAFVDGHGSAHPDFSIRGLPVIGLLKADVQKDGDGAVLSLAGEFDLATLDVAERGLQEALDSSESGRVTIDLREVTFLCATGIHFLAVASKDLGPNLTVIESEAPAVKRVLSIVGLDLATPYSAAL